MAGQAARSVAGNAAEVSGPGSGSAAPVLSFGEALVDMIVDDGAGSLEEANAFVARTGGAPANVTVALARLGVPSAFAGVVGDDPFGRRLRRGLAREGVDGSRLRSTAAATTMTFAWKDGRGDGHFWLLRAADIELSTADVDAAGIEHCAAIVVGSVALAAEPSRTAIGRAVEVASGAGVPVCVDVNLRPTLWPDLAEARAACQPLLERATLIKLSLDDARGILGADDPAAILRELDRGGAAGGRAPSVVLTDGDRGCWFGEATGEDGTAEVRHVPAFAVAAVEPTGAGDAFCAALLSRLLGRGWDRLTEEDVRFAAAAGALATTKAGAWEGLPTADELNGFLAARG